MKLLLYYEKQNYIKQSGIGRSLRHQSAALESAKVSYSLKETDPFDIVHINTSFNKSYQLLKKCKKKGIPVIVHGHSTIEDFRYSFRCWKLLRYPFYHYLLKMYRNADAIITPTNYSKNLISSYKNVTCPIYALSNGIKIEDYAYKQENVDAFNHFFKIQQHQKVVIGVGLYFRRKGLLDFFEIAKRMPNVKFIWFGQLNKIITENKIVKAIKNKPHNVIMPGYIDGAIIKGAFSAANALLFPSYEETEGIVILEALAAKLPIVVRDIPVYEGWLKNSENCLKASSNKEFIHQLQVIFNENTDKMKENGYQVAYERRIEIIGENLKNIYTKVSNKYKKKEK